MRPMGHIKHPTNRRPAAILFGTLPMALWLCSLALASGHEVPAPLLYVRVQAPVGTSVAFLEGAKGERSFDGPVTVGLKPGYAYRLRIDGVPDHPNLKLYPTLEVGGTLRLPPRVKAADFPALLQFTETDLQRAAAGALVTKVIVVEDPDSAPFPLQDPDHPNEWELRPHEDPIEQAKSFGRSVMILWLGLKEPEAADLAKLKPGLILFPDMKTLPAVNVPPCVDPSKFFDRRHLVNDPVECVRDGGDRGQPAYFEPNGNVRGVNPSDTVAEYKDVAGHRRLAITNEVCVFAPRFLAVRHELPPLIVETVKPIISVNNQQGNRQVAVKQNTRQAAQADDLQAVQARDRLRAGVGKNQLLQVIEMQMLDGVDINIGSAGAFGSAKVNLLTERDKAKLARQIELALNLSRAVGVNAAAEVVGPRVVGMVDQLGHISGEVETRTAVYLTDKVDKNIPEKPLMVYKWASAEGAKVGDVVTFYIRYVNHGGKPIREIAVVDSLSKRLEYIPGSAKSDREAILVTQDNEAGSVTLRWEVRNSLPPGEQGVVSFQARVR